MLWTLLDSKWVKWNCSVASDFATPWTVAYQAPPSMGFSRQEYWSGLPFPSPGDLPNPGIDPGSPTLQADALTSEPPHKTIWHIVFGFFPPYHWQFLNGCHVFLQTLSPAPKPSLSYGYFTSSYPVDLWMIFKMSFWTLWKCGECLNVNHV